MRSKCCILVVTTVAGFACTPYDELMRMDESAVHHCVRVAVQNAEAIPLMPGRTAHHWLAYSDEALVIELQDLQVRFDSLIATDTTFADMPDTTRAWMRKLLQEMSYFRSYFKVFKVDAKPGDRFTLRLASTRSWTRTAPHLPPDATIVAPVVYVLDSDGSPLRRRAAMPALADFLYLFEDISSGEAGEMNFNNADQKHEALAAMPALAFLYLLPQFRKILSDESGEIQFNNAKFEVLIPISMEDDTRRYVLIAANNAQPGTIVRDRDGRELLITTSPTGQFELELKPIVEH